MELGISNINCDINEKKEYQEVLKKYHYNQKKGTIIINTLEDLFNFQKDIDYSLILADGGIDIFDDWID